MIGIAAAVAVGVFASYWFNNGAGLSEPVALEAGERAAVAKRPPLKAPRETPSGFAEYRSEFYRFQLLYPDSLSVTEHPVPVSAVTLVFSSLETGESFQVFIVPHGSPDITDHRLQQDLPSGVMEGVEDIEIAGAKGIAFQSHDPAIGQTREIWFVARGFLYEVTAPLTLDAWLSEIMRGWEFI